MARTKQIIVNKDFDLKFTRMPSGDVRVLKDPQSTPTRDERNNSARYFPVIQQSLSNILLTNRFERPFNPEFGGNIHDILFELAPNNQKLSLPDEINIQEQIKYAIGTFEPRVVLEDVNLGIDDGIYNNNVDNNRLQINIKYSIPPQNDIYEYSLEIKRVR